MSSYDKKYKKLIKKIEKYQREIYKAIMEVGPHAESMVNFRKIQINDTMTEIRQVIEQRPEQQ